MLTDHQKEIMREHKGGGAMGLITYSGLEDADSQFMQVDDNTMTDSRSRWGHRSDTRMHPIHDMGFASPPAINGVAARTTPATVKAGKAAGGADTVQPKTLEVSSFPSPNKSVCVT